MPLSIRVSADTCWSSSVVQAEIAVGADFHWILSGSLLQFTGAHELVHAVHWHCLIPGAHRTCCDSRECLMHFVQRGAKACLGSFFTPYVQHRHGGSWLRAEVVGVDFLGPKISVHPCTWAEGHPHVTQS